MPGGGGSPATPPRRAWPGLSSMPFDTPSLPMSCSSAVRRSPSRRCAARSRPAAIPSAYRATRALCPAVKGLFASTTSANAAVTMSSRASSISITCDAGSSAATRSASPASASPDQKASVCDRFTSRATRPGSNHVPDRRTASARAASGPPSVWKTSMTCASSAIRAPSGIASPARPSGRPRPFQCSSSEWIPADTRAPNPSWPAIGRAPLATSLDQL